jgi:hypothetical protein
MAQNNQANPKINLKKEGHSPKKATLRSLIIPGWGQAYNRKYWKIPIIYAGFGFIGYLAITNRTEYLKYKEALFFTPTDENPDPPNEYYNHYSSAQLESGKELHQRNMELSFIIGGLWYLINVIDATVDGHLFNFEVSEDLSFRIEPDIKYHYQSPKPMAGFKISFTIPNSTK